MCGVTVRRARVCVRVPVKWHGCETGQDVSTAAMDPACVTCVLGKM